jgi:hypothetical protein
MRRLIPGILLLALMAGAAGCDNNTTTTPTTPTTPSTPGTSVTETFTGTLNMNGAATYPFTAGGPGTVTATLTSVAPDSTVAIGLLIGAWTGSACQNSISNDSATQTAVVTGTVTAAAALCARVYDTGKVTAAQPVNFTVTIVHP